MRRERGRRVEGYRGEGRRGNKGGSKLWDCVRYLVFLSVAVD